MLKDNEPIKLQDWFTKAMPLVSFFMNSSKSIHMAILDGGGRILYANQMLSKCLKVGCAEMAGKSFYEFLTEPDAATLGKRLAEIGISVVKELLLNVVDADQVPHTLWFSFTKLEEGYLLLGEPPQDDNQALQEELFQINNQMSVLFRDNVRKGRELTKTLTDLKCANSQLADARAAADSANIAKSQFLANMSHEIRTPMNGVIGMTELLKITDLTKEQTEYVEALDMSGHNLLDLINDILDLSKVESGKIEIELAEFSLHKCINDIVLTQKSAIYEKGLVLEVDLATEIPHVLVGDQLRVKQILLNLLGNAIKFTAQGRIAISARVIEQHEASVLVQIAVRDTGIGISAENLDKIFMPFVQADKSTTRKYGGTGLGLAICKQLAEVMGGGIGVESPEGGGANFWFSVLFENRSVENILVLKTPAMPWVKKISASAASGNNLILLVEDDPINQFVAKGFMLQLGFYVDIAENGYDALQLLSEKDYPLVLMDCQMPQMGGLEITAVIRDPASKVRNHSVPVIALTANALKGDRERCLAAGMNDYLTKPLHLDSLSVVLSKWLPTAPDNGNHVFDEAGLLKRHNGNEALAKEIALMYAAKAPQYIAAIQKNLEDGNHLGVHRQAHSLKGASATLGANKISTLASELAALCEINELDKAKRATQQLKIEFECLLSVLTERGWLLRG